jgi:hypothetical protein
MALDKCDHIIKVAFVPVNREDHLLCNFVIKLKYAQNLLNGCCAKQQFHDLQGFQGFSTSPVFFAVSTGCAHFA